MTPDELLQNLLRYDRASLADLAGFARSSPADALRISWTFLSSAGREGHVLAGYCEEAIAVMHQLMGKEAFERTLVAKWDGLGDHARANICYGAMNHPTLISTDCALKLWGHERTSWGDRFSLLENLVVNRSARGLDKAFIFRWCDELLNTAHVEEKGRAELFVMKVVEDLESAR